VVLPEPRRPWNTHGISRRREAVLHTITANRTVQPCCSSVDLSAAVESGRSVQQAMPVTSLSVALYQRADAQLGGLRTSTAVVRSFLEDERGRCPSHREEAMNTPLFVVLFDVESVGRQVIREVIGTAADIVYLPDVEATARAEVLRRATVILAQNTAQELTPDELALIHQVRLLQFYTAGVDFIRP
jgi:hypothetical protein